MKRNATQLDLIQYAYNETGLTDSDRIQRAIDGDPVTAGEFQELVNVMELLDREEIPAPSEESIRKILARA